MRLRLMRLAALQCGKAAPYRDATSFDEAMPPYVLVEARLSKKSKTTHRRGRAFAALARRQSRMSNHSQLIQVFDFLRACIKSLPSILKTREVAMKTSVIPGFFANLTAASRASEC